MEQAIGQGHRGLPRADPFRQALHRRRQRRKRLDRSRPRRRSRLQRSRDARRHLALEGFGFERRRTEVKTGSGQWGVGSGEENVLPIPHSPFPIPHSRLLMPLYLVSTPIGNLEDITLRALRVLKEVDLIACEDTRRTRRLLDHFGISKPTISYHEHNEPRRAAELAERLSRGESIALVTDAGTPGISDPAYRIVVAAVERGVTVTPLPGATAMIAGLVASGLPTDSFLFAGFLPHKKQARCARLVEFQAARPTLIFYETPHRIREALNDAREILGDRQAVVARELTKLHEEFLRGPLSELIRHFEVHEPRGEMTLVIAGNRDDNLTPDNSVSISEQVERLIRDQGMDRNDAIKRAAHLRGLSKREAYRQLLDEKQSDEKESDGNEEGID